MFKPVLPNVRPCECWELEVFSFKISPQSLIFVLYIARWKKRKNLKIRWSKIYLDSLLSKTTKCSNVVNQMKTKREVSNDQMQVRL